MTSLGVDNRREIVRRNDNTQAFLALLKAGLWNKEVRLSSSVDIDYLVVLRIAEEQSVVGLVTDGLGKITDAKVPQKDSLRFIASCIKIEQQNKSMNLFVAEIIELLCRANVCAILVKGQGIAQCYETPLRRSSGDVDLLLSKTYYRNAKQLLSPLATSIEEENTYNLHIAMTIAGWQVELHGSVRSGLWRKMDRELDKVIDTVFYDGKVRLWKNGQTQVLLPAADEDVVIVFSHILQHFYKEGIGLRQICDWCRLLWTFCSELDLLLLESRVRRMGVMTEWKAFAALAVDYLGMPLTSMPFYSSDRKWSRKAEKIMTFVLETGSFGHNRDYSYRQRYPFVVFKAISLWRHIRDFVKYVVIFPKDSMRVTWRRIRIGFSVAFNTKEEQ